MDRKLQEQYEARAGIIKAIAHPSRLFIVEARRTATETPAN
jgi:hypothetical protein